MHQSEDIVLQHFLLWCWEGLLPPREIKINFQSCDSSQLLLLHWFFRVGSLSFCSMLWDRFFCVKHLLIPLTNSYSYAFILIHIKCLTLSPRCLSGGWQDRRYPKEGRSKGVSWLTLAVALFPLWIVLCFCCGSALCPGEESSSGHPASYKKSIIPWRCVAKLAFWQSKYTSYLFLSYIKVSTVMHYIP